MKLIRTEDAAGQVLCHDITQIIKGVTKDEVFRKGHIITEEDIPVLLSVGKDNIYIWEKDDTMLHENEAAQILYDMCKNDHMHPSDVKEGKIELIADCDGLGYLYSSEVPPSLPPTPPELSPGASDFPHEVRGSMLTRSMTAKMIFPEFLISWFLFVLFP